MLKWPYNYCQIGLSAPDLLTKLKKKKYIYKYYCQLSGFTKDTQWKVSDEKAWTVILRLTLLHKHLKDSLSKKMYGRRVNLATWFTKICDNNCDNFHYHWCFYRIAVSHADLSWLVNLALGILANLSNLWDFFSSFFFFEIVGDTVQKLSTVPICSAFNLVSVKEEKKSNWWFYAEKICLKLYK